MIEDKRYLINGITIQPARSVFQEMVKIISEESKRNYPIEVISNVNKGDLVENVSKKEESATRHANSNGFKERTQNSLQKCIDSPYGDVFIATSRQGILGVTSADINRQSPSWVPKTRQSNIKSVYTSIHNMGIGTALLDMLLDTQNYRGASLACLDVVASSNAVLFYKNYGFRFSGKAESSLHDDGTLLFLPEMILNLPRNPRR